MSNYGTFGENNPVWKAVNRFADMMVIGIWFLITCLPLFTIGAALSAFYYTAMDSLRKEDGYIFRRYFRNFGKNFKKGTLLWLIMLALGAVFSMNIYVWLINSDMQIALVMLIISAIILLAWMVTFVFVFPLQARFENTIGKTIQNAFLLGISNLPFTIAVIILVGMLGYLCYISWLAIIIMLLFGTGLVGYLLVYNYERLFKKCGYIEEDDGKVENDDYEFDVEVDFDEIYHRNEGEQLEELEEKPAAEESAGEGTPDTEEEDMEEALDTEEEESTIEEKD